MRNLKRALSLALASVMLLGMMVVGAGAASYPDVDANDNVEAIEVLNAVKVMIGKQGNFEPDSSVNRHEMAVIMAKLVLGNEAADNYVGSHPFTDVVPWADKYVAACYENGLVAGTSATTFGGSQQLTAVQAAAMMLRALGYKDLSKGATDWRAPVTAAANRIRLFADVASNPSEKLTRNQVAQLALNTLKSPMVDTKDNTLNISGGSGDNSFTITGGGMEYVVRSSTDTRVSGAILRNETAGNGSDGLGGWALELGEHLYNGKLRLTDEVDAFGRPARHWEYDGKAIGDYAKKELVRISYTEGVKGGKIYTDIGSEACDYDLEYWIDGVKLSASDTKIQADKLARRNDNDMGKTGRGVLTEVYVDTQGQELTIVEIHTYLAQATADYNSSNERLSISVFTGRDKSASKRLELEDFPSITGYKKDDYMMITMADGDVKSVADPTVVADAYVSAYASDPKDGNDYSSTTAYPKARVTQVTADGKVYKNSQEAYHDAEYLYDYTDENQKLDGYRYDLLLDNYGYFLGIKNVTADENCFFVVGYEASSTYWGNSVDKANVIFPDGTMSQVSVKAKNDGAEVPSYNSGYVNMWYDYSVNSDGVYVISGITNRQFAEKRDAVVTGNETGKIDSSHTTMATAYKVRYDAAPTYVFGNDASVYIAVKTKTVSGNDRIDEVSGVSTGIKSTSIEPTSAAVYRTNNGTTDSSYNQKFNVFGLYNKDGYVTYAVVIGNDGSVADNLIYLTSGIKGAYYDTEIKEYVYQYEAITKDSDEIVLVNSLVRKTGEEASGDPYLQEHNLYKAHYDAKGLITKMELKSDDNTGSGAAYNTQAYKDYGYGRLTVAAPTASDSSATANTYYYVPVTLVGNTLFFADTLGNNAYVLINGDTRFFVNNTDDPDDGYELYSSASSALAALGDDHYISSGLKGSNAAGQLVAICDTATGYAKTVIFLDRLYEEDTTTTTPADGRLNSAKLYSNGDDTYVVEVELTAAVTKDTDFEYVVTYVSLENGRETVVGKGTVRVNAGQSSGKGTVKMTLPVGLYYITIDGKSEFGPFTPVK